MWTVYVLKRNNGTYYTGCTSDTFALQLFDFENFLLYKYLPNFRIIYK